ncbi:DNA polymerase III subunit delta' [Alkanindiges sp. WGS2144]|uniref:DNA polymerase III subunit delta' n=1 Tax=Alkanindiges sp. WGS2144 TaxID=3366808 RepID=UPI0037510ABA
MTKISDISKVPDYHYFIEHLPWQQKAWHRIVSRFPKIPHAILLSGNRGTGKRLFADQLAAWLLCLDRSAQQACGECSSCQWLKADTHPGLLRISPEVDNKGKTSQIIKIDQIRDFMPFVQQTGKGWRVVIIEPAESLNIAAANALLKTLEEPGEQVTLILVSDQSLQLPATIRSRLQQYRVGEVSTQQALDYLTKKSSLNQEKGQLLLNISGGAPLAALLLAEQPAFLARQEWLNDWQKLLQQRVSPISLSTNWQKRLTLPEWLSLLQWMLRDVIAYHLNQPVMQTDLDFTTLVKYIDLEQLFGLQQQILEAIHNQTQNIQAGLVYDSLMMQLMNLLQADTI